MSYEELTHIVSDFDQKVSDLNASMKSASKEEKQAKN